MKDFRHLRRHLFSALVWSTVHDTTNDLVHHHYVWSSSVFKLFSKPQTDERMHHNYIFLSINPMATSWHAVVHVESCDVYVREAKHSTVHSKWQDAVCVAGRTGSCVWQEDPHMSNQCLAFQWSQTHQETNTCHQANSTFHAQNHSVLKGKWQHRMKKLEFKYLTTLLWRWSNIHLKQEAPTH